MTNEGVVASLFSPAPILPLRAAVRFTTLHPENNDIYEYCTQPAFKFTATLVDHVPVINSHLFIVIHTLFGTSSKKGWG